MKSFHNISIGQALKELNSSERGLKQEDALLRLSNSLGNDIDVGKKRSKFYNFLEQFKDLMILILLIAATVSITIGIIQQTPGEIIDGSIILAIVLMNAIIGVIQESKAEKSLEALKKMTEPEASVLRNGEIIKISTKKIVLGDIVVLDAGCIVPADIRLIESASLSIDESSLTGESYTVEKRADEICREKVPLADRHNMCYRGTLVTNGRGLGLVVGIGKDTEIGKIAESIKTGEKEITPLQKSIKDMGKLLTFLVLGVAVVTFFLEVFARPGEPMQAFLTAVAISVAAIPESMPAVITIIMSLGIARLAKQKAVVKRMHSVETLGCCDVICSDKTGTITQNRMSVVSSYCDGLLQNGKFSKSKSYDTLLSGLLLCNDTSLSKARYVGDPTEVALSDFGKKLGVKKEVYEKSHTRIDEKPFDSTRKLMSTLNKFDGKSFMFTKGAVDNLLKKCDRIMVDGKILPLSDNIKNNILKANSSMADNALRVLAVSFKEVSSKADFDENNLVFVGLVGMIDPPRKEIQSAVKKCKAAGMRPVMITGDHKDTAFAVAKQIGIVTDKQQVMTGAELDNLSDAELKMIIESIGVFARVSPENKVRIVEALKANGHVVAMTGDGVNDAPSLKRASIGIGMGIAGTDVTKEVADIIVTDDNFATIVVAVEEGRKIYQNIQKAVKFLFSANMGELLSLFLATIFFPHYVFLFPVQILFVNLITDTLPAIALGVEPPEKDLMSLQPRKAKKSLFSDGNGASIIILGVIQTLLTLASFHIGLAMGGQEVATTMAFYTLNIIQMFYLASMRTNNSMFKSNPFKNKIFVIAVLFGIGICVMFACTPLHSVLNLVSLNVAQWFIIFGLSVAMMFASELFKFLYKLYCKKRERKEKKALK